MSELQIDLEHAGISEEDLAPHAAPLRAALAALDRDPEVGFLDLPERRDLIRDVRAVCRERAGFNDVVQLGIGGSSLGAQALCAALVPPGPHKPRLHFPDNIDPESFGALLDSLTPRRTLVHVVSKSGGTLETQAQLHALIGEFRRRDPRFSLARNLVVTTGPSGSLRALAEREGARVLDFPEDIGGRFSVFTASGLLAPALAGVPIARVLSGARRMLAGCRDDDLVGPAGRLAALHFLHDTRHARPIHVELIYADALQLLGDWFSQLWAESLGKGGRGPTPVVARGTTDQHSQVQLYVDGPDDKVYTVVRCDRLRRRLRLPRGVEPSLIAGREMGEIFEAEALGTLEALIDCGRPVIELRLPRISPETVGEVLLLQQLQTALAGTLYEVNPFDQPGVEAGKRAAVRLLTR
jgi:glucose-6-phosphate isomerase